MNMRMIYSMRVVLSPIAQAVQYWPSSGIKCLPHCVISVKRDLWSTEAPHVVAVIIFQIINPPISEGFSIVGFKVERALWMQR